MAIKLPTHTWLFNNDLRPLREGRGDISFYPDRVAEMRKICDEYDQMEFFEDAASVHDPIIHPNVGLPGYTELIAIPKDKDKLRELLLRVHEVVREMWVPADIYRRIGQTFQEYGFPMEDEELKLATELASGISSQYHHDERTLRFNARLEVQRVQNHKKEIKY